LGNWDINNGLVLSAETYPVWRGTATLSANLAFEYKYIKKNGSQVIRETGANRVRSTGTGCSITFDDTWRN
jgi:alpha-amylase